MQYIDLLKKAAALLAGKAPVIIRLLKMIATKFAPTYVQLLTDVEECLAAGDPNAIFAELEQIWADIKTLHDDTPEIATLQATYRAATIQTTAVVG